MYRRTRKPNFSKEETLVLLEQIEKYNTYLFGKAQPPGMSLTRANIWDSITEAVNAVPSNAVRTVQELKHRWKDLTHRARTALRNVRVAEENGDRIYVTPSLYYDKILRILGETTPPQLISNPEHLSLKSEEAPENNSCVGVPTVAVEVDVKPDVGILDQLIRETTTSHNDSGEVKAKNNARKESILFEGKSPSSAANLLHSLSKKAKQPSSESGQPNPVSASSLSHGSVIFPASRLNRSTRSSRSTTPVSQTCPAPPMMLDPNTQQVMQVQNMESVEMTQNEQPQSVAHNITADYLHDAGDSFSGVPGHLFSTKPLPHPLDSSSSLQNLSMEELQKQYLISKIKMVNQKRSFFQLEEDKLRLKLQILQQRLSSGLPESAYSPLSEFSRISSSCQQCVPRKRARYDHHEKGGSTISSTSNHKTDLVDNRMVNGHGLGGIDLHEEYMGRSNRTRICNGADCDDNDNGVIVISQNLQNKESEMHSLHVERVNGEKPAYIMTCDPISDDDDDNEVSGIGDNKEIANGDRNRSKSNVEESDHGDFDEVHDDKSNENEDHSSSEEEMERDEGVTKKDELKEGNDDDDDDDDNDGDDDGTGGSSSTELDS